MTTTIPMDESSSSIQERPGAQLAAARIAKGYSVQYIAQKLRLRVSVVQLLEADDYTRLPVSVFVRGYFRAYAKLLDISADPLLELFNRMYAVERNVEKALWQSRREPHRAERGIRWLTTLFGLAVLISVAVWWQKSKDNQALFATTVSQEKSSNEHAEADIRLTDLSKMRSLLSSDTSYNTPENKSE